MGFGLKHQARVTSQTVVVGPWGGPGGDAWDDGIHTGIQNIILQFGDAVDSIQVDYDVNGDRSARPHHGGSANRSEAIKLAPEEYIVKVSGYVGPFTGFPSDVIRSLTFTTNLKTYGPFGVEKGTPFSLPINRGLVVGFTGRSGRLLDAIGVRLSL
ncbi:hypothetical protein TIFTF001_038324 [Ficus carica]|uniref:Jacalin-type lectin domain-containing protein n=1 Tax=Ficus carica TaxID=3494 RepID=A0AA88E726_FICCA|nr:hypothetical protein TIFTF001_038324 [Ficus carica]